MTGIFLSNRMKHEGHNTVLETSDISDLTKWRASVAELTQSVRNCRTEQFV